MKAEDGSRKATAFWLPTAYCRLKADTAYCLLKAAHA